MAQSQLPSGLKIDTSLTTGQLSLHNYRKYLSQDESLSSPPRVLKRKQAAVNLNIAQAQYEYQMPCQHEFSFHLRSPVSSAPSSPPPLSSSQSVISLHGDIPTPISPGSTARLFTTTQPSLFQRMDPFSIRLKKNNQPARSHSRSSSQLTLPSSTGGGATLKINHNGTEFEILNPKDPLDYFKRESSPYQVEEIMENESPSVSPVRSLATSPIPEDMVRPISASESAILSKIQKPAIPPDLQLLRAQDSLAALPLVEESESPPSSVSSPSLKPRTTARSLKQKVSRLFGSTDAKQVSHKSGRRSQDAEYQDKNSCHAMQSGFHASPGDFWQDKSTSPMNNSINERFQDHDQPGAEEVKAQHKRTRTGPHASNRHHTLQDALRQLETQNNGLTYDDIMQFIGAGGELEHARQLLTHEGEEGSERPWQPDTWQERPRMQIPFNRASDSNLSTNAPSTHPSIRPYAERAAAFMAGENDASFSSESATAHDGEERCLEQTDLEGRISGSQATTEADIEMNDRLALVLRPPIRRIISRRARPLSSNPPDLDVPLISSSPPSTSKSPTLRHTTRISWCPEIPARHPDHHYEVTSPRTDPSSAANPSTRPVSPFPHYPQNSTPETVIAVRKKQKKIKPSICHCL